MYRIAILCSFNLDLLPLRLKRRLNALGMEAECYTAPFGQHYLAALEAGSELYAFKPEIVFVFVDLLDILGDGAWSSSELDAGRAKTLVDEAVTDLSACLDALRSRLPKASILVHTFCLTTAPLIGALDLNGEHSVSTVVDALNRRLVELRATVQMTLIDYAGFVERHGWENLVDRRLWYHGRMRFGQIGLERLAELYSQYMMAVAGRTKKCLVCDLDNTLWGGVVGEVGLAGIELSEDGLGKAYKDFQREILGLRRSGVLLAISSKNEMENVVEAFERHPEMVLHLDDFNAVRANWNNKAENIQEIAEEIGIGLESIVFMDDSPVECELIRWALPEVTVLHLPADPVEYPGLLRSLPWFQRISLSDEDRLRPDMMRQDRLRKEVRKGFVNHDEFLRSLGMVAEFTKVGRDSVTRAAQLTQRTNQFNLTGRRYIEQEMAAISAEEHYLPILVRIKDRFGDDGFIGLAIAREEGTDWEMDAFVMSCRVLGRGVETALLSEIARLVRASGARRLIGRYVRTKRNTLAEEFLPRHGFVATTDRERWALDLSATAVAAPDWIEIAWKEA